MTKSSVSIITPVKNGEKWIKHCILSVSSVKVRYEHIIVYSPSNDKTLDVINSLSVPFVIVEEPSGTSSMYQAIQYGLSLAKYDILCYLNSDDQLQGLCFSAAVESMATKSLDVLYCSGFMLFDNKPMIYNSALPFPRYFLENGLMPAQQPSCLFSRRAYNRHKFDLNLKFAADLKMFLSISRDSVLRSACLPLPISKFLVRSDSLGALNYVASQNELNLFCPFPPAWHARFFLHVLRSFPLLTDLINRFLSLLI